MTPINLPVACSSTWLRRLCFDAQPAARRQFESGQPGTGQYNLCREDEPIDSSKPSPRIPSSRLAGIGLRLRLTALVVSSPPTGGPGAASTPCEDERGPFQVCAVGKSSSTPPRPYGPVLRAGPSPGKPKVSSKSFRDQAGVTTQANKRANPTGRVA